MFTNFSQGHFMLHPFLSWSGADHFERMCPVLECGQYAPAKCVIKQYMKTPYMEKTPAQKKIGL